MKFKWSRGIATLLACLLVFVSGCTKQSDRTDETPAASVVPVKSDAPLDVKAGMGPYDKYDTPVEIKMGKNAALKDARLPEGDTLTENLYFKFLKDKYNIDVSYSFITETDEAYQQKVSLAITSRDIPDVFVVSEQQVHDLVEADLIEDITSAYDTTASPLVKEMYDSYEGRALSRATIDGKLYGLPGTNYGGQHTFMWIRKDWLAKVGMEIPKTVSDLEAVAKAFVEKDPDADGKADTLGLTSVPKLGGVWNQGIDLNPIFGAYHAYIRQWLKDKDGNIIYGGIQPEAKNALGKLRDLYTAGLIDKEFATRTDAAEPIINGQVGIISGPWWYGYWPLPDSVKLDPKADWVPFSGIVDDEGKLNVFDQDPTYNSFLVVRKGYEHPEAILKVMNAMYDNVMQVDPESRDFYKGMNVNYWAVWPTSLTVGHNDTVFQEYQDLKKCWDAQEIGQCSDKTKPYYQSMVKETANPKMDSVAWGETYARYWGAALTKADNVNIVRNQFFGITQTMNDKKAILDKLQDETYLNIIMGREPLEKFDDFAKEWLKIGGAEIIKEITELNNAK